jgi:hypothetical protein
MDSHSDGISGSAGLPSKTAQCRERYIHCTIQRAEGHFVPKGVKSYVEGKQNGPFIVLVVEF